MSAGLTCSYAVISTSVACTAPAVRKALNHVNRGRFGDKLSPAFLIVNGGLLVTCALAVASTYPAGRLQGESFALTRQARAGIQALVTKAKVEQNLGALASVTIYTDMLGELTSRKAFRSNQDLLTKRVGHFVCHSNRPGAQQEKHDYRRRSV